MSRPATNEELADALERMARALMEGLTMIAAATTQGPNLPESVKKFEETTSGILRKIDELRGAPDE